MLFSWYLTRFSLRLCIFNEWWSLTLYVHIPVTRHRHTTSDTTYTCSTHWTTSTHTFFTHFSLFLTPFVIQFNLFIIQTHSQTPYTIHTTFYCRVDHSPTSMTTPWLPSMRREQEDKKKYLSTHIYVTFSSGHWVLRWMLYVRERILCVGTLKRCVRDTKR